VEAFRLVLPRGAFHALAVGDGAPVVYLHGFPDHPPTAAPFLRALAARGHRVIAPWLRGYAPSPLVGPFDVDTLVADLLGLLDHLSPRAPVALVGHDWGAAIAYAACIAAPSRIARAVTLALPHPLTVLGNLARPAQLRASWYMLLFQLPGAGTLVTDAFVDRLWRAWSPDLRLDDAPRAELHACLRASMPAPLGTYRALVGRGLRAKIAALAAPIRVPLLQLHGARDGCVLPPGNADARRFAAPRVYELVDGVGHFLHVERPDELAARIADWLR